MTDFQDNDWSGEEAPKSPAKDRPLHPAGTFPLRVADMVKATPGLNRKTGEQYARVLIVWLSGKRDEDGNPLWIFTTAPHNTYGGMQKGKPTGKASRLRGIFEALAGHPLTDEEAKAITPSYVRGLYALCKVTHWDNGRKNGAQVESAMALPDGMEVDIPMDSYVRPPGLGKGGEA